MTRESFHTDPLHGRPLPQGRRLQAALAPWLARIRSLTVPALRRGQSPDLATILPAMQEALLPAYSELFLRGVNSGIGQIRSAVARKGLTVRLKKQGRPRVVKAIRAPEQILELAFDVFNPRVIEGLRRAVFDFCQSTIDTAYLEIEKAKLALRVDLLEGLQAGETNRMLAARVETIFAEPYKAARIAQTEASRAVHSGELILAKESEVCSGKYWMASSDACKICLGLAGMGVIPLEKPYMVLPKGGPYAIIMHPGAHPFCQCSQGLEITDDLPARIILPTPQRFDARMLA